jgi:hypothetical protein
MPSESYKEEKNLLALSGIKPISLGHSNVQYVTRVYVVSGFLRDVNKICARLGLHAA